MQDSKHTAGQALARALGERAGAPVGTELGRSLLLALVRLHELGALDFSAEQLSTVPGPQGQPGAVVRCDLQPTETAPAYNMGQSVCIPEESA